MTEQQSLTEGVRVHVENVGGIDSTTVDLQRGVNVLSGRNATNRTSFLQSMMAALGSEDVSLKGDADRGEVELTLGEETYTRTLERLADESVAFGGDPYLDDPELADLFAFLLESNEARRAVATGGDLRSLIMEPIDTDAIRAEIERLETEKRDLESELDALADEKRRLPKLEERRASLRESIEEKREKLRELETQVEEAEADPTEAHSEEELEETLAAQRETRGELEDVRYDIETQRESVASLRSERADLEAEREDLAPTPEENVDELDAEIRELRDQKASLDSTVNEVQNIVRFNESRLDDDDDVPLGEDADHVTDRLVDDTVTCWTCGSEVEREAIEATLDRLRELRADYLDRRRDVDAKIESLTDERESVAARRERRETLDRRLANTEEELEEREARIEELEARRDELNDRVAELEEDVERLENDAYDEVLELHRAANEAEFELGRLEDELASVEADISEVEDRLAREAELRDRREEIGEELVDCRTRIERIETDAVEAFNEHMDVVLDILDYANLDRVWLERVERTVREGRRTVQRGAFELHIVRRTESGTAYEDTVDHLSESEREVTGLVFALAGYLVHEVHETLPFVLLDSLEAIDSDRIAHLVEYLAEHAPYLVVALLPEDAAALPNDYHTVSEI